LFEQPSFEFSADCSALGQVLRPLNQGRAFGLGLCVQGWIEMARNAQQRVTGQEQSFGHGEAHAARCAGQDGEVLVGHGAMIKAQGWPCSRCWLSLT
jgi:hypothetical protein